MQLVEVVAHLNGVLFCLVDCLPAFKIFPLCLYRDIPFWRPKYLLIQTYDKFNQATKDHLAYPYLSLDFHCDSDLCSEPAFMEGRPANRILVQAGACAVFLNVGLLPQHVPVGPQIAV